MRIRVYTLNKTFPNWPTFSSFEGAIAYCENNSGMFDNGETIALIDFTEGKTQLLTARLEMKLTKK
jgi:hypothetical protein